MSRDNEIEVTYNPTETECYTAELIDRLLIEPLRADLITQLDGRLIKKTPCGIYACFENHENVKGDYWPETFSGYAGFVCNLRDPQALIHESLEILMRAPGMDTYNDVLGLMRSIVVHELEIMATGSIAEGNDDDA